MALLVTQHRPLTMEIQRWAVTEPWLHLHCSLGEGPFFEAESNCLRFVDIKEKKIHTVSVSDGQASLQTLQLDVCPTVTADIEGINPQKRILVGVKYGIAILDRASGKYELLAKFNDPDNERIRSNDGAVDPRGQFWLGTMTDFGHGEVQAEGSLFCFSGNEKQEIVKHLAIPNSIGWSPDGKIMYYTHSTARQIFALDYDIRSGAVSNQRLFYQHPTSGEPDGFRIDVNGNLWTAVFGEGKVLRISTAGQVTGEISLPTRYITCVQFVGNELFVTSAADDEGEKESRRCGGGLFRVDVGTTGLSLYKFKLHS